MPDDAGELTVVVDGETVVLAPGGSRTLPVAGSRALSLPGVLDVRVTPGLDDAGRDDAVRERSRALAEACEDLGVADLDAARAARRDAEDAARRADEHRAALARELAGHGDAPALRAAHDAVRSRLPDDGTSRLTSADVTELRAAADTARADAEDAAHRADEADAACRSAEDTVREADTRAAVLAERAAEARHAHTRRLEELEAARAAEPDATLAEAETTRLARARDAEREHEAMAAALADDDPDTVEARVLNARAVAERLSGEGARLEREHAETTGRLQAAGLAGWHDQLAAAELELDAAVREHAAVARRAAAARRLHETLTRHRERVRRSYVAPFRAQVERLARIVFGPSLALEIDEDLRITHRTLDGTTVPFGGALQRRPGAARAVCAAGLRGARRPVRGRPGGHRRRARPLRPRAARPPRRRVHRGHLGARRGPGRGAHLHARALPRHRRGDGRAARAVPQARRARRVGALRPRGRPRRRGHARRDARARSSTSPAHPARAEPSPRRLSSAPPTQRPPDARPRRRPGHVRRRHRPAAATSGAGNDRAARPARQASTTSSARGMRTLIWGPSGKRSHSATRRARAATVSRTSRSVSMSRTVSGRRSISRRRRSGVGSRTSLGRPSRSR